MAADRFAEDLLLRLRRSGLKAAAFAARVGISPSTLSRILAGKRAPTAAQAVAWADALELRGDERDGFVESALSARTPPEILARLGAARAGAAQARDDARALAGSHGRLRAEGGFHDGWWISHSLAFSDDGRIQRCLLRIEGTACRLEVRDAGRVRYRYHGELAAYGDHLFLRLAEDRGGMELVQLTLQSLFAWSEPSFLLGIVCGISGTDLDRPVSHPAAARILLLHAGGLDLPAAAVRRLEDACGLFPAARIRPCWPGWLPAPDHHRRCLGLAPGDDFDDAVLATIANRIPGTVLRGDRGAPPRRAKPPARGISRQRG